jgi:hypothetical protein
MAVSKSFTSYQIYYYSSHTLDAYYDALIYCYSGATFVGRIEFYKEATAEASLKSAIVGGLPYVRFRLSRFQDVITTLRQEGPTLTLSVNDANGIGTLATGAAEPTAEAE